MKSEFEIWKWIPHYEGYYKGSNCGSIKRTRRIVNGNWKQGKRIQEGRIMKCSKNNSGYLMVRLCKDGVYEAFLVHRLIAELFITNKDNLPEVNHKDENKWNNHVDNLEWCSRKYNCNYGTAIERSRKKKINGNNSKTILQYTVNGEFIKEWVSAAEVERQYGYSASSIGKCCRNTPRYETAYGYIWKYA